MTAATGGAGLAEISPSITSNAKEDKGISALAIALERINEAAKTLAESLDLSNLGLKEFPPKIAPLPFLKTLDISNNEISCLPTRFESFFEHIKEINLSNNSLTNIPDWFQKLENLIHLNLTGNKITKVSKIFSKMTGLSYLGLSNNPIKKIPINAFESARLLVDLRDTSLKKSDYPIIDSKLKYNLPISIFLFTDS